MSTLSRWSFEHLVRQAFTRTKDRFWNYLLVQLSMIAAFLVLGFLLVVVCIPLIMTGNNNLIIMLIIPASVVLAGIAMYFLSWFQLVLIDIMTNNAGHSVKQSFATMKSHVVDFFKYNILVALFFLGLLPFGVMTLFALLFLWGFWSTFAGFVFLYQKKRGLDVLWTSRAMVNQKFWQLALRLAGVSVITFMISSILSSQENILFSALFFFFNIVVPPFMISYTYGLYKLLDEPKHVHAGTNWVLLSVAGWIVMGIIASVSITALQNGGLKRIKQEFYKQLEKDGDVRGPIGLWMDASK